LAEISITGVTANVWHHGAAVFASSTSRTPYLNGVAGSTETTSKVPASVNRISVGRLGRLAPIGYMDGNIAEAAIWNVALTQAEISALATGALPVNVRPSALVFYAPLLGGDSPEPDLSGGGRPLTVTGATSISDLAPLRYPDVAAHIFTSLRRPGVLYRPHTPPDGLGIYDPTPAPAPPAAATQPRRTLIGVGH
jgi:hypothetical protein